MVEQLRGNLDKAGAVPNNPERLDQGKQTKLVFVYEWSGPCRILALVQGIVWNDKGAMEMRNSGDVPGVTGHGACAETACVVDKIGDDDFDDLHGKSGGGGRACRRGLQ